MTGNRVPAPVLAAALLISLYEWAVFVVTPFASGVIGLDYKGIGTDWMAFDAAARIATMGGVSTIYDGQVGGAIWIPIVILWVVFSFVAFIVIDALMQDEAEANNAKASEKTTNDMNVPTN